MKLKENSRIKQIKKNKPIFAASIIFTLLFAALFINVASFLVNDSYDVISSDYNPRQEILAEQNIRGDILTEDGTVLAITQTDGGEEARVYPYGPLFAHAVGYSTYGETGIEDIANMSLVKSNQSISTKVSNDIKGRKDKGDSVICSLNVPVQETASKAIGVYKGAAIVTEVKTGKIIAMISKPDFDPNTIKEDWEIVSLDEETSPLLNRASQGLYPPGSTFKIIDLLEYVKENPDSYDKYTYNCNGYFEYDGRKIRCYHGTSHGFCDLRRSFAKSCNCSFANIGVNLDRSAFSGTLNSLLFGSPLPVDFVYSDSKISITPETEGSKVVQASIGQGDSVITPLHLNLITQAIANKGVLMKPILVEKVVSEDGDVVKEYKTEVYKRLMSASEAEILTDYMTSVVEAGTGDFLRNAEYTSAGKTGSAEFGDVKGESHAWFTGFAPVEDPEVCVTVLIEGAGSGGDYAVPIAKRLMDSYFEQYSTENSEESE